MSAPVDVLAVLDRAIASRPMIAVERAKYGREGSARDLIEARAAVAELIERDKASNQLFDCILRGLNDLTGPMGHRSEQFVAGWLENWAWTMHAAGFKPANPVAPDIARALARIVGDA